MGNRIVPYEKDKKCDECGVLGAVDFMGDYLCHGCLGYIEPSNVIIPKVGLAAYTELGKSHEAHTKEILRLNTLLNTKIGKINNNEWLELIQKTQEFYTVHPDIRLGQSFMNALFEVSPKLYKNITNTDNDPFYNDQIITKFIKYLIKE